MKVKTVLLILLLGVLSTSTTAQKLCALNVNLTDGSMVQFVLPVQQPTVTYGGGEMTIFYRTPSGAANDQVLTFKRDQVADMTIVKINPTAVSKVRTTDQRVSFNLTQAGVVRVAGLNDGDQLQVFAIDGKQMQPAIFRQNSEATVDLNDMPRGLYVVSVNQYFTFKMMKP